MKKTKRPLTARRIHLWIAVILAIPLVLLATSGILISMRSVANIPVPMKWMSSETVPERLPIMAYLEGANGTTWVGNANGLNAITPDGVKVIEKFAGQEVVGLAALPGKDMPIVATRMAIWTEANGSWEAVKRGRVRQLSSLADGSVLAIAGGRGEMADGKPMVSRDGTTWVPYKAAMQANAQLPQLENPSVALHTFMRELHSGAYFLGKGPGEMVWSNVLGWVLVLLALTGLWMWLKRERQRVREINEARLRSASKVSPQGTAPKGVTA